MCKTATVIFACLISAGHAQRVSNEHLQTSSGAQSQAQLAQLLLALTPKVAFNPSSCPGGYACTSKSLPIGSRQEVLYRRNHFNLGMSASNETQTAPFNSADGSRVFDSSYYQGFFDTPLEDQRDDSITQNLKFAAWGGLLAILLPVALLKADGTI
mmetsp:Transcript_80541/g.148163  ORF Transcript_80541/g.148163 Transcript_80541/m.148163 type:complete len:156 (-) Transcript_80541:22-489(-)